ncbi:Crp/Fnr family transcriptional regulator [Hydrotalea sp.]|uniref:Crp/Fnr family transcriptional regulator n=1 Tax=Hydrotalea sp. TaxID=2881279 RepID=UPI0026142CA3|nr:Crp/Fnr family transcriptional regulator [Hydrotalea sp.]
MKKEKDPCNTNNCFLCRHSLPAWLPAVAANKTNLDFKRGVTIFEEGMPVNGIYFIFRGKVKVHKKWGSEKQFILHFAKEGDVLGYRGLGNEQLYPVSATTLENTMLCFFDIPFFENSLKVNTNLLYAFMQLYASELQQVEKRMGSLVHLDVKGRVAETLLKLQTDFGVTDEGIIQIWLTKQELAAYAGTTYETFFRILHELVQSGIVQYSGKNMVIVNEAKLKALL